MSKKRTANISDPRRTQVCPLCGSNQPLSHRRCTICGTMLPGEPTPVATMPTSGGEAAGPPRARFDPAQGDDDLFIGDLQGRMWRLLVVGGIVLALAVGMVLGWWLSRAGDEPPTESPRAEVEPLAATDVTPGEVPADFTPPPPSDTPRPTAPPTATPRDLWPTSSPTYTLAPMMQGFVTVTPVPPTPTITPTPGPCYQTAGPGDTVYGLAARCGHRDMAIVDVVLEVNGMKDPIELQVNQTLEIPWPTPTPGGESEPQSSAPEAAEGAALDETVALAELDAEGVLQAFSNFEPTLRPGLAWHEIQSGETMLTLAWIYGTNMKTLSELNPEIPFLQCDFGYDTGGDNCAVMLVPGQRVRVPVPLPTTTPSPTPSGTRTPTPTPTATYNAPFLISPADGTHFFADQRVTLRWGGTGTLGPDEHYLVRIRDLTSGAEYAAPVEQTMYILPGGWQPADRKPHTLEWTISIVVLDADFEVTDEYYITAPREFKWDSR